ncbi:MAG: helix-turn-helix domain-containing protein [Lacipirellulaceae bacterium]
MHDTSDTFAAVSGPARTDDFTEKVLAILNDIQRELTEMRERSSGARKDFYTIAEFAEIVKRSPYTARQWVREGRVAATRVSGTGPRGRLLIARSEIDKIVRHGLGESVPP